MSAWVQGGGGRRFVWTGDGFTISLTRRPRYWTAEIREGNANAERSDSHALDALLGLREDIRCRHVQLSDAAWAATYDCAVAWSKGESR